MKELIEVKAGALLRQRGIKIAVAESCTGGLVANRITDVPGSSSYFLGGLVAYANEVKAGFLGVSWDTLNISGAVSRNTVLEMAIGVRKNFQADIGLSVTGIAGPDGGTKEKPVGTTWVGLAAADGEWARGFCWDGDRESNKQRSADAVLSLLLDYLMDIRDLELVIPD